MAADTEQTAQRDERSSRRGEGVNSGGQGLKGAFADAVGELEEVGAGLVVGAAAYKEGAGITPNPYFQYGTVETGGYGGPPNIGAVSHVFALARHNALIFADQVLDDTTGNAAAVGQGVGTGLAPELVTLTPLTGQAARDAEVEAVTAAADYQTAHPVMLHGLDDSVVAAGQPADEFGNPTDDDDAPSVGPVGGGAGSGERRPTGDSSEDDYSDSSDRDQATGETQSGQTGTGQKAGASQPRSKVDPTRQQGSSSS